MQEEQSATEQANNSTNDPQYKRIRLRVHGDTFRVDVDIRSLREALGLPPHDLYSAGIFHEYQHNPIGGPDLADTDHGAAPLDHGAAPHAARGAPNTRGGARPSTSAAGATTTATSTTATRGATTTANTTTAPTAPAARRSTNDGETHAEEQKQAEV